MAWPGVSNPESYLLDDSGIIFPLDDSSSIADQNRAEHRSPFRISRQLPDSLQAEVVLKVGDNITTDHIMPAGNKVLPLRSNIPAISEYVFEQLDAEFPARAKAAGNGIVIAGENYGQGSSREHAAIAPRYLGIRAKIVKSFARIHKANLVNFGILPLVFKNPADMDLFKQGDQVSFPGVRHPCREWGR